MSDTLPLSRTELAIAELCEKLAGVGGPEGIARDCPNAAQLMAQRRALLAAQASPRNPITQPPPRSYEAITNASMDAAIGGEAA